MEHIDISLGELESAFGYNSHMSNDLVEKVKADGWKGIDPIPVIEIPEEHRIGD